MILKLISFNKKRNGRYLSNNKRRIKSISFYSKLDDEKILSKYGITRKELLEKRPLNKSTLTALKTILVTSEKTIQNAFHQSKDEVLHLRTITVEMINDANQKNSYAACQTL